MTDDRFAYIKIPNEVPPNLNIAHYFNITFVKFFKNLSIYIYLGISLLNFTKIEHAERQSLLSFESNNNQATSYVYSLAYNILAVQLEIALKMRLTLKFDLLDFFHYQLTVNRQGRRAP